MPRAVDDPLLTTFGRLVEVYSRLEASLGRSLQERHGMPHVWFEVLVRLARSPGGRLTMGELAQEVALTSGGVTRLVDRMVAAGHVARAADAADRRVAYATVTRVGRAAVEKAARSHAENLRAVFAGFDGADLAALDTLLDRLRDAAG
jgi:DNA-binding MarR family transcriptional regulator